MKITFGLSAMEIKGAIKEVQKYQNSLQGNCELLCERLSRVGIAIAEKHIGNSGFGKYISLTSEMDAKQAGCRAIIIAQNKGVIHSEWKTKDEVKSAEVSPILMLEFGSGLKANNPVAAEMGMGTGTFPNQKHAFNSGGWWYMDLDGKWHHSNGVEAKMPMYQTSVELAEIVQMIAKEVFNS